MKAISTIAGVIAMALLASCVKDELPVPKQPRGDALVGSATIGSDYSQQVWYDLGTNSVVSTNDKMAWDLAFNCAPTGWEVRINSSHFMRAVNTGQTDISQPTDTTGFGPRWDIDLSDGDVDSLAIGDWRTDHPILLIDMGYNVIGLPVGLRKLQVLAVSASSYQFQLANVDGSNVQAYSVQKDPTRSYVHFSITAGSAITIAPPLGTYDLVFTQFTKQFYAPDPVIPYLVTGAINGFSNIRVAEVIGDLAAITLDDTVAHPFSRAEDAIGYNWKDFSFGTSSYAIYPDHIYIIQDTDGLFFKLHFIDFYSPDGLRGTPTFELMPL